MTLSPIHIQEAQEAPAGATTAYDSTWATAQIPEQGPVGSEKFMLAEDKLFVVLAVVLIIWAGIAYYLFKTDRKILEIEQALAERTVGEGIPDSIQD